MCSFSSKELYFFESLLDIYFHVRSPRRTDRHFYQNENFREEKLALRVTRVYQVNCYWIKLQVCLAFHEKKSSCSHFIMQTVFFYPDISMFSSHYFLEWKNWGKFEVCLKTFERTFLILIFFSAKKFKTFLSFL